MPQRLLGISQNPVLVEMGIEPKKFCEMLGGINKYSKVCLLLGDAEASSGEKDGFKV